MSLSDHDLKIISVRELMKEREKARKESNFALSDKLRDRLKREFQVDIVDQVNGPRYPFTHSLTHFFFLTYLIFYLPLTNSFTFVYLLSGWKFTDGSTRKFSSGAVVPENVQKKRKRDDSTGTYSFQYSHSKTYIYLFKLTRRRNL